MNPRNLCLIWGCIIFCIIGAKGKAGGGDFRNTSLDFEMRAADLVDRMTLEEKISQLGNNAPGIERLDIKPYDWWNECLHGVARAGTATVFPQAIAMAASFDRELMYEVACAISDEARAKYHEAQRQGDYRRYKGLTFWSPNINIFRDPRWGRGHETYGEDPYLTGQMGIQFVCGLQGNDPKYLKLVATAKHFAVHNGPEKDRHHFNVVPNARDLWETYLPAFYDLVVTAKTYSVMGAYNRVDGESASASWMLLEDILRQQWGFEGYVVSDCGAIRDIYAYHQIVNDAQEAAAVGIRRGCELNCGSVYQRALLEAVQKGFVDEGEIDLAVYRLMLARMKLGMFDPDDKVPYAKIPYSVNDCAKHNALALDMARECMTLLKNDGILPLDKSSIKTLAVVGPNADSVVALRGNYNGDASHPVTVLEGIRKAVGDEVEVLYSHGCSLAEGVEEQTMPVIPSAYLITSDDTGQQVQGLKGEYYRGIELQGDPVLLRIDAEIDMKWGTGSPTDTAIAQGILTSDQKIDQDNFSIRWTGQLLAPVSGLYKLGVTADDGCRLYLNGEKVAEGWFVHSMQTFSGEVALEKDRRYDITVEYYEGTKNAGVQLVWERPEEDGATQSELTSRMLAQVAKADVAIFVGGLDAEIEGEEMSFQADGFDRGDRTKIELPAVQLKTLRAIQQTGTPVIFVLMAGSAIAFDGLDDDLSAILMGWYPGQRGGDAVAEVLFGQSNPAGRLPVTFYTSTDELGDFSDYTMTRDRGKTYRYYQGQALYPFGHGLSYTKFSYSDLKISDRHLDDDDDFTVSVKVKNVGDRAGQEVVQLYVRDVESDLVMPVKQLRGFERIALNKGESNIVTFKLNTAMDLRHYSPIQQCYTIDPGAFEIQVGSSSGDIRMTGTINVE